MQPYFRVWTGLIALLMGVSIAWGAEVSLDPSMNQIRGIQVYNDPDSNDLTVTLEATQALEYTPRTLSAEDTGITDVFYLNLPGCYTMVQGGRNFTQRVEHSIVKRVRLNQYRIEPPMVRLVFDLHQLAEPEIKQDVQTQLQLLFAGEPVPAATIAEAVPASEQPPTVAITEGPIPPTLPAAPATEVLMAKRETVVLPLKHYPAMSIEPVVQPLLSPMGVAVADEWTNSLIVRDTSQSIQDLRAVIQDIDRPQRHAHSPGHRTRGTIQSLTDRQITLVTKKDEEIVCDLPEPMPKRLAKRLAQCAEGDLVRLRWVDDEAGKRLQSIRKPKPKQPSQ